MTISLRTLTVIIIAMWLVDTIAPHVSHQTAAFIGLAIGVSLSLVDDVVRRLIMRIGAIKMPFVYLPSDGGIRRRKRTSQ